MNSGWYFPQTTNVIIIMPSFFRYELLFCLWFPYRSLVWLHVFVALIFVLYTLYVYIYIYISAPFTYEFIYFYFITRMCMCYKNLLITRITNVMFCVQGQGLLGGVEGGGGGWRVMNPQLFDHYLKLCVFHISWF